MAHSNKGKLEIHLKDVIGQEISDEVRLTLDNLELDSLDSRVEVNNFPTTLELVAFPKGFWTIYIQPKAYRPLNTGQFVNIPANGIVKVESTVFINAHLAKPVFPTSDTIFVDTKWVDLANLLNKSTFLGKTERQLWEYLITSHKLLAASLLNLYARTKSVILPSGRDVFSYFQVINNIKQDRLFVVVDSELHADVVEASNTKKLFKAASGLLHPFPAPFKQLNKLSSFKTKEKVGNLQITFAQDPDGRMMVDVDVDDHAGIKHAFDVLKHAFTGEQTHPYDIHQILSYFYQIDLGYKLVPRELVS